MKRFPHLIPAAVLTVTLAAAVGAAWADPVPPAGPLIGGHRGFPACSDHEARLAARLAYAEVKLNLTAPQKVEFKRLSESLTAAQVPLAKLCVDPAKEAETLPLPARLERVEALAAAHLDSLHQSVPALTRFYKTLTPEQQAVADTLLADGPGGHGGHWGHGPRRVDGPRPGDAPPGS